MNAVAPFSSPLAGDHRDETHRDHHTSLTHFSSEQLLELSFSLLRSRGARYFRDRTLTDAVAFPSNETNRNKLKIPLDAVLHWRACSAVSYA